VEEDFRPARKAHPGLLVDDIDDWATRLKLAGYPVAFDDDFPGMRRFYSQDPHGNRLEFLEPLRDATGASGGLAWRAPTPLGENTVPRQG
jgi:hypothetical protein